MRAAKQAVKKVLVWLVKKLCEDDQTKRAVTDMLSGLLPSRKTALPDLQTSVHSPYAELGRGKRDVTLRQRREPVFVTGRFRSGSTLLWNLFRKVDGITAYYEPLNERRWFDPLVRGTKMDATHKNVEDDYWREYDGLEVLGTYYQEDWIRKKLYMDAGSWDPALKRYVEILIEKAPGRPVLQFNRVDFRLPWLRHEFPEAKIIHLYRNPRDQWCSALMDLHSFPKDAATVAFEEHDKFYTLIWARDLKYHFPFLDEKGAPHPYRIFYYLWKMSYLFGRQYGDYTVEFEKLVANPDSELPAMFKAANVEKYDLPRLKAIIERPALGKWKSYASDEWFREHETVCETVLADFFGSQRST